MQNLWSVGKINKNLSWKLDNMVTTFYKTQTNIDIVFSNCLQMRYNFFTLIGKVTKGLSVCLITKIHFPKISDQHLSTIILNCYTARHFFIITAYIVFLPSYPLFSSSSTKLKYHLCHLFFYLPLNKPILTCPQVWACKLMRHASCEVSTFWIAKSRSVREADRDLLVTLISYSKTIYF